jgi:hypothetical protein
MTSTSRATSIAAIRILVRGSVARSSLATQMLRRAAAHGAALRAKRIAALLVFTPGTSQAGVKIEASVDGTPFYEIADLTAGASRFENTGIERPAALRYRLRACNRGGYSAYSSVAQCEK